MGSSFEPAAASPELPFSAEGYRPLFELGRGGMARVYLAERVANGLRKLVVLKVLDPALVASPEMRSSFHREAVLCARLNHPNIVQVFEVHDDATAPMMVMEYVEGITLSQLLTRCDGRLPIRLHVHIIIQALAGLHYFHELQTDEGEAEAPVHRDVSPQNIMVMHEGAVKVLDFGIAKVQGVAPEDTTKAGVIKGKLSYMPAEQLSGDQDIDRRADVFAAGVMLWECFARQRMWQGYSQHETVTALVSGKIPSIREACPWISSTWEQIIMRAVAGKREDRYPTALDLQVDMENNLAELGGVVQQRELATFMKTEFADMRSERRRLVESEARKAPVALTAVLQQNSGVRALSMTPSGRSTSLQELESEARSRKRGPWVAVLGLAGAIALGVGLKARFDAFTAPAATSEPKAQAPKLVTLSVAAWPVEANVVVDGQPVGSNPWSQRYPVSPRKLHVEVTAPGHSSFAQDVSLETDANLSVRLEAVPPAAASAEPPIAASTPTGRPSKPVKGRHVVSFTPAASPAAAPAAPKPDCTPPYVLDTEGVKTYKPECL
ncbi:MAG: serine/threonine-protein kinase [Myxococcales bacterium]